MRNSCSLNVSLFIINFAVWSWALGDLFHEIKFQMRKGVDYEKDIKNVIVKYKINKNFALSEIKKKTERLIDIFDVKKHFHYLKELKMFIFTKRIDRFDKLVQSPDFITEVVKSFSKLYPLYSFCISPQPHKILSDFTEKLGLPS